jgi:hypothetical protein
MGEWPNERFDGRSQHLAKIAFGRRSFLIRVWLRF